jgi:hypothetical protein
MTSLACFFASTGGRSGLKGLKFAAKLKKTREDRHQSRFGEQTVATCLHASGWID